MIISSIIDLQQLRVKMAILGLTGCLLSMSLTPVQAGDKVNQVFRLTAFDVALSDSASLQMYTRLPVPVGKVEHDTAGQNGPLMAHYINSQANYPSYAAYRLGFSYPGIGLRYSVERDWFVYGETRLASYRPRASEPVLFRPDEPRSILIGGGIHF